MPRSNYMEFMKQAETKMKAVIEHLKQELKGLRTGRANPAMLDNLQVEVYGSMLRLREVANITAAESRQLLVTVFDRANAPATEKAIQNFGFQARRDGAAIRVDIPPMDQNMRKEMIKQAHQMRETAKVSARHVRREVNDLLSKLKTAGKIGEDDVNRFEKQIQKATDEACKEIDGLITEKEKEISTI